MTKKGKIVKWILISMELGICYLAGACFGKFCNDTLNPKILEKL